MRYRVGQLVMNSKLGLGKVLSVSGDNVTAVFKDQKDNPRTINVAIVPMTLAKDQSDPSFEGQATYKRSKKGWTAKRKPKAIKVLTAKVSTAKVSASKVSTAKKKI